MELFHIEGDWNWRVRTKADIIQEADNALLQMLQCTGTLRLSWAGWKWMPQHEEISRLYNIVLLLTVFVVLWDDHLLAA